MPPPAVPTWSPNSGLFLLHRRAPLVASGMRRGESHQHLHYHPRSRLAVAKRVFLFSVSKEANYELSE